MLVRILNMRGVNLNVFEIDRDLTWASYFLNADQTVLGRFGGREADSAERFLTLSGLKVAMRAALHRHGEMFRQPRLEARQVRTVDELPAARKLRPTQCIHCHQVYDFERAAIVAEKRWSLDDVWAMYPPSPARLGLMLDPEDGISLKDVAAGSAAARAGFRSEDRLRQVNGLPVASFADVQYALHKSPAVATVPVLVERNGAATTVNMSLPRGWRQTDISWRQSMWGIDPPASVYGTDLTAGEKKQLGLKPNQLAFRQAGFVPPPARQAGIREGDLILGINNQQLSMTMLQFNAHIRLNFKPGDRVTYNLLRDGKRLDVPFTLVSRSS